jgi:hypothetical protein
VHWWWEDSGQIKEGTISFQGDVLATPITVVAFRQDSWIYTGKNLKRGRFGEKRHTGSCSKPRKFWLE